MNLKFLPVLVGVLTLAACSSVKDASEANFANAINKHMGKQCLTIKPGSIFDGGNTYPVSVHLAQKNTFMSEAAAAQNNAKRTAQYEALVKAGLLRASNGQAPEKASIFSQETVQVPARIYALTPAGEDALANKRGKGLCVAEFKVEKIVQFTEPTATSGGTTSGVEYTYGPAGVAAWAKTPEVRNAFPWIEGRLTEGQTGRATLVLTNNGWVVESDTNG